MFDLTGKTALVTGQRRHWRGSDSAACTGCHGGVAWHPTEKLEALQRNGKRAFSLAVDLSTAIKQPESIDGHRLTGPISILVNNAGITRDGLLMRMKVMTGTLF